MTAGRSGKGRLRVGDRVHDVELQRGKGGWTVVVDGEAFDLRSSDVVVDVVQGAASVGGERIPFKVEEWSTAGGAADGAAQSRSKVRSPMSGKLVELRVREGASVAKGDVLFVLEAMKMQNEVRAPAAGRVTTVQAKPGDTLDTERVVLEIEPHPQP